MIMTRSSSSEGRATRCLYAATLAALMGAPAFAQDFPYRNVRDFQVSSEATYAFIAGDYRVNASGARVGLIWNESAALEAEYVTGSGQGDSLLNTSGGVTALGGAYQLDYGYGVFGRAIYPGNEFARPFVRAGLAGYSFDLVTAEGVVVENFDTDANLTLSIGAGLDLHLTEWAGVRLDATVNYLNSAAAATAILISFDDGVQASRTSARVQTDISDAFITTGVSAFVRF